MKEALKFIEIHLKPGETKKLSQEHAILKIS
jgi:hypothetical protein